MYDDVKASHMPEIDISAAYLALRLDSFSNGHQFLQAGNSLECRV